MLRTRSLWWVGGITAVCLVAAAVSYFLTWHEFPHAGAPGAWGCAFLPDCKPSLPPPGAMDHDSGHAHAGTLPVAAIVIALALTGAALWRPRTRTSMFSAIAVLVLTVGVLVYCLLASVVAHLLVDYEAKPAEAVFFVALLVAFGCAVALIVISLPSRARSGTDGSTGHPPASPAGATSTAGS